MEANLLSGANIGERWRVAGFQGEIVEDTVAGVNHTRHPIGTATGAACVIVEFRHASDVWAEPGSEAIRVSHGTDQGSS